MVLMEPLALGLGGERVAMERGRRAGADYLRMVLLVVIVLARRLVLGAEAGLMGGTEGLDTYGNDAR